MAACRLLLTIVLCACATNAHQRDPRGWFDGSAETITVQKTVVETITELTPSSCMVIQTSLPACRHVRNVREGPIQPTHSIRMQATAAPPIAPAMNHQNWQPVFPSRPLSPKFPKNAPTPPVGVAKNATASGSWWDIFSFGNKQVTVTETIAQLTTTKALDPNYVVTFSVKGCRPSRLPFDLPECHPPKSVHVEAEPPTKVQQPELEEPGRKGVIVMAPIQIVPMMPNSLAPSSSKASQGASDGAQIVLPEMPEMAKPVDVGKDDAEKI